MKNLKHISCLLVGCLLMLGKGWSQSQSDDADENLIQLIIKPNICVAPRGESSCISHIDISWSSPVPADYCLHVNAGQLRCWQAALQGEYRHHIIISESLDYWLTHSGVTQILAQSTVKFAALKPHRKQMRRRSQLPWSVPSL